MPQVKTPILSEEDIHDLRREYIYGAKTKELADRHFVSAHTIWKCVTLKALYSRFNAKYCLNSENSNYKLDHDRYATRARFVKREALIRRLICPDCYAQNQAQPTKREKRVKTHLKIDGCQYAQRKIKTSKILYSDNPTCQHCQTKIGQRPYQSGKPRMFDDQTAEKIQAIHKTGMAAQVIASRFNCHKRTILQIIQNKGAYKRPVGAASYD